MKASATTTFRFRRLLYWQVNVSDGTSGPQEDGGDGFSVYCTVPVEPAIVECTFPPNRTIGMPLLTAAFVPIVPESAVPSPFSVVV